MTEQELKAWAEVAEMSAGALDEVRAELAQGIVALIAEVEALRADGVRLSDAITAWQVYTARVTDYLKLQAAVECDMGCPAASAVAIKANRVCHTCAARYLLAGSPGEDGGKA